MKIFQDAINEIKPVNLNGLDGLELVVISHSDYINVYIHHNKFIISDVSYKDDDGKIKSFYEILDPRGGIITLYGGTQYTKSNLNKSLGLDPLKLIQSGDLAQLVKIDGIEEVKIYNVEKDVIENQDHSKDDVITIRETYHTRNPKDFYSVKLDVYPYATDNIEIINKLDALYTLELLHIQHETVVPLDQETFDVMVDDILNFKVDVFKAFSYLDGYTSDRLEQLMRLNTDTSFKKEFLDILEGYAEIFSKEKLKNNIDIGNRNKELAKKLLEYPEPINKGNMILVSDKVFLSPLTHKFTEVELLNGKAFYNVELGKDDNGKSIIVPATLEIEEPLTYFQYLILCAIVSIRKQNPDIMSISILDIANQIHRTISGRGITIKNKLYKQVVDDVEKLMKWNYEYDTRQQVLYKQSKRRKKFMNLSVDDTTTGHFIEGRLRKIEVEGQPTFHWIDFHGDFKDNPLYQYIQATNQLYELPPELTINPLNGNKDTISLFYYLATKVNNMPFGNHGNIYFAKQRLKLNEKIRKRKDKWLRDKKKLQDEYTELQDEINRLQKEIDARKKTTFKDAVKERLQSELSRKKDELTEVNKEIDDLDLKLTGKDKEAYKDLTDPLLESYKNVKPKDRTIKLDTLEKFLGITKERSRLARYIKQVLDYWKSQDIIKGYTTRKNGKKKTLAYTINFF